MVNREWLDEFANRMPHQPTVALHRAIELEFVSRWPLPRGFGIDIGCGDGTVTSVLISKAKLEHWRLVGIDPDPFEVNLARQRGCYVRVHIASAEKIPEKEGEFDFAFSNSVLEHIPDIDACLVEIARVLRRDAPFIFTVPSEHWPHFLKGPGFLYGKLFGLDRKAYLRNFDMRTAICRYWPLEMWRFHLERAGFRLTGVGEYLTPMELQRIETVSNLTGGLLFTILGCTKRPVEIQRGLGIRRLRYPLLIRWISKVVLRAIAVGLDSSRTTQQMGEPRCCYLIECIRL
jgi:SAM-dependent methyltransferase